MKLRQETYKGILDNINEGVYFLDVNRKITYWNSGAARMSGYTAKEVVGLSCSDNILVHTNTDGVVLCNRGCPVAQTLLDGMVHEADVFMHHKDGYRVPVRVCVFPIRDPQGNITGAIEIFRESDSGELDRQVKEDLKRTALLDPLTELPNRRNLEMRLNYSFAEIKRHGIPFGVVFCDIDHFKSVNDTFGHQTGDEILKMVASTLKMNLRATDFLGRWGGEEFLLLMAHINGRQLADISNKLRLLVGNSFIDAGGRTVNVTITMGCTLAKDDDTPESVIARADRLLYKGKAAGRNRVVSDD